MDELFKQNIKKGKEVLMDEAKRNYYSPTKDGYWANVAFIPVYPDFTLMVCANCRTEIYISEKYYQCTCDSHYIVCQHCKEAIPEIYSFRGLDGKERKQEPLNWSEKCVEGTDLKKHNFGPVMYGNK